MRFDARMRGRSWVAAVGLVIGCSRREPSPTLAELATAAPAYTPTLPREPSPPKRAAADSPLFRCPMCRNPADDGRWYFSGEYADAKCTRPVAHVDTSACGSVPMTDEASVHFAEPSSTHERDTDAVVKLHPLDAPRLFAKRDGKCAPFPNRPNSTPVACVGLRVCRGQNDALTCTQCATLENGCPKFAPSRLFAEAL